MPVLDLAQRFQDTYRVRLGDMSGRTKEGKPKPVAFEDRIRITAAGPEAPQAFCDVYGSVDGRGVTEWEDDKSPDCWEVYLPVKALPIWILPGQVITQWWELWRGKVCERRCEGTGGEETLSGTPCKCSPDIAARIADKDQCNIMTRLSIMCPKVETLLGSGSLVTHSLIAAETLPSALYLAGPWLSKNIPVSAVLRTHTHKGRTTFTFPTVEIGGPVDRTPELDADHQPRQIDAAHPPAAAIGTGSQRGDVAPPAPPAPFDESNETLVGPSVGRVFVTQCKRKGFDMEQITALVQSATDGRAKDPAHVRKDEWERLVSLVPAEQAAS